MSAATFEKTVKLGFHSRELVGSQVLRRRRFLFDGIKAVPKFDDLTDLQHSLTASRAHRLDSGQFNAANICHLKLSVLSVKAKKTVS